MTDRIIAQVRDYDQLIAALRARVAELDVAGETVDHVAGIPLRYTMKLLAPVPVKSLGRSSMGPLLGALGLKLLVVEDHEALEKIRHRLVKVRNPSASIRAQLTANKGKRNRHFSALKGNPELARLLAQRRVLSQSPRERSAAAIKANDVRWGRKRRRRRGGRASRTARAAAPRVQE